MSRTMAVHVRYNSWYISCRPLQNNKGRLGPILRYLKNLNYDG